MTTFARQQCSLYAPRKKSKEKVTIKQQKMNIQRKKTCAKKRKHVKQHRDKHVSAFFCLSLRFVLLLFCVVFAFCIVFDLFFWRVHLLLFALFFFSVFFSQTTI